MHKKPRYQEFRDIRTGKLRKEKPFEFSEEWDNDDNSESGIRETDIVRKISCPLQYGNTEVIEQFQKPLKKATFKLEVELDFSLSIDLENKAPEHLIIYEGLDTSKIAPNMDLSEYEIDLTHLSHCCDLHYKIEPKIQVTLINKEVIEDKEVESFKNKILKESDKLAKDWEYKPEEMDWNSHKKLFNKMQSYLEKHLSEELKRVVERLAFEIHILNESSEVRENQISIMLSEEETELRKRLETPKGRKPLIYQSDFKIEKKKFVENCFKSFREFEKNETKINQTKLAESLFRDSNPHQSLRRKFKTFNLTFNDILQKYTEQKSS